MKIIEYFLRKDIKDDKQGIFAISLVDKPAIEVDFIKLREETEVKSIKLALDEDRHIITGPALIPDIKIYRSAESMHSDEDCFIYFSEQTVRDAAHTFISKELNNEVTLMHDVATDKVKLLESWIIEDPEHDKAFALGFNLPKGTWMVSHFIEDEALWQDIKSGKLNGYSIESLFYGKPVAMKEVEQEIDVEQKFLDGLLEIVQDIKP